MAVVIVGLRDDVARAAEGGAAVADAALQAVLDGAGAALVPLHPGTSDPDLRGWFYAEVDEVNAEEVAAACLRSPAVTAAYVKPADSAP